MASDPYVFRHITGTIITKYEDAFAAIPLLVSFIPMLMDTGGNCGSQSATLIIRGLPSGRSSLKISSGSSSRNSVYL